MPVAGMTDFTTPEEFVPPLPECIVNVLKSSNLCYLATCEGGDPHLSLMKFSVLDDIELGTVLILSTKRATKKFAAICGNPKVAVLVHDFEHLTPKTAATGSIMGTAEGESHYSKGTCSVTVYGEVTVAEGELDSRCRAAHLANHDKYPHFILGEDVAVLVIQPKSARICNIHDNVSMWDAKTATK